VDNQFCPSRFWDHLRCFAAGANPIDLVLLVLLSAFGLSMCMTLAADAEVGRPRASLSFSETGQSPDGGCVLLPISGSQRLREPIR
jgi:hypothetical protein